MGDGGLDAAETPSSGGRRDTSNDLDVDDAEGISGVSKLLGVNVTLGPRNKVPIRWIITILDSTLAE